MLDYVKGEEKPISRKKTGAVEVVGAEYLNKNPVAADIRNWSAVRSGHSVNLTYVSGEVVGTQVQVTVAIDGEPFVIDTQIVG